MCDTFVVLPSHSEHGVTLLGKNSDREPNEAQVLSWFPPTQYGEKETVSCTYRTIPQVKETRGVLLSRPFWLWGAEMGVNDAGVAIGNEAVFTKEPEAREKKLLGMDMLRLALERSGTAEQALEIIIALLNDYGQGGPCGFEDTLYYHNSFLIADNETAWVLETAGDFWVALQVKDRYAISNGLTIGAEYDRIHPGAIDHARQTGRLKKGRDFSFRDSYSDWFYTTFSGSGQRQRCSLRNTETPLSVLSAFRALRDHGDESYAPSQHVFMNKVCAHAAYPVTRHAAQSTGSLVAYLEKENPLAWVTGTSAPCTGWFKPVWLNKAWLPPEAAEGKGTFEKTSLWWQHEQLHREILNSFPDRISAFALERDDLEKSWVERTGTTAPGDQAALTEETFETARRREAEWLARMREKPVRHRPNLLYRQYWKTQNRKAGMETE